MYMMYVIWFKTNVQYSNARDMWQCVVKYSFGYPIIYKTKINKTEEAGLHWTFSTSPWTHLNSWLVRQAEQYSVDIQFAQVSLIRTESKKRSQCTSRSLTTCTYLSTESSTYGFPITTHAKEILTTLMKMTPKKPSIPTTYKLQIV